MGQYTKKPVTIEAVRFVTSPHREIEGIEPGWYASARATDEGETGSLTYRDGALLVGTTEGVMTAQPGDWIIRGVEGEIYPCKDSVFRATYVEAAAPGASAISFSEAIRALKAGERVCRAGWNGKGMWLALTRGYAALPAASFWNAHNRAFAETNGGAATVLPVITMKTATGEILMGWLASQTDMLAEDWMVLPDDAA